MIADWVPATWCTSTPGYYIADVPHPRGTRHSGLVCLGLRQVKLGSSIHQLPATLLSVVESMKSVRRKLVDSDSLV